MSEADRNTQPTDGTRAPAEGSSPKLEHLKETIDDAKAAADRALVEERKD